MAAKSEAKETTVTNYDGLVANQETSIRDAKVPDEKPDEKSVAQVEEVKE